MDKNYGSWSISDLKSELRKRKAKVTGKKATLVQRLVDYDKLFGPLVTDSESVFKIAMPAPEEFKDITTDSVVPALTNHSLESFIQVTERQDLVTSRNMYDEYFLMSCRLAHVNDEYFITGVVSSEMRKSVSYNVAVKVKHLIIIEAQCECAAGMGPYAQCKHVLIILYAIIDVYENKKIKLKTSPTNRLQTFHHPNRYHTGDPQRADELILKQNYDKYNEMVVFDPRPTEEILTSEKYRENFCQQIKNYCGQERKTQNIPMAAMLQSGDKENVFKDHDYLSKTNEQIFLESLHLSQDELDDLEKKTRMNKKTWKRERLMRMHSSKFGNICKSVDLHKLAKSLIKDSDITSEAIRHGIKYEGEAIHKFEESTQLTTTKCGIIVNKEHQFLASTPDRLIEDHSVLEVKCPYSARNKVITPETVPYIILCEKTGQFKLNENHDYYYQVQGQMMCTGRQTAYFCVYTFCDFLILSIKRDNNFISTMFSKLNNFYEDYFKKVIVHRYLYHKKD